MSFRPDYYEILQVSRKASPEIIQAAYRKLAQHYHPDRGGDNERMKLLNEAHEVLMDVQARWQYDSWLSEHEKNITSSREWQISNAHELEFVDGVRPWIRFWARTFDMYIYSLIFGFTIGALGLWNGKDFVIALIGMIVTWPFIEAFCISKSGTTPGKWLLKTEVLMNDDTKLTYTTALYRATWTIGLGAGAYVPIVSLIAQLISYNRLATNQITDWDNAYGCKVIHRTLGVGRSVAAIISFIVLLGIISSLNQL